MGREDPMVEINHWIYRGQYDAQSGCIFKYRSSWKPETYRRRSIWLPPRCPEAWLPPRSAAGAPSSQQWAALHCSPGHEGSTTARRCRHLRWPLLTSATFPPRRMQQCRRGRAGRRWSGRRRPRRISCGDGEVFLFSDYMNNFCLRSRTLHAPLKSEMRYRRCLILLRCPPSDVGPHRGNRGNGPPLNSFFSNFSTIIFYLGIGKLTLSTSLLEVMLVYNIKWKNDGIWYNNSYHHNLGPV